jgi:inner membrane protease subunit 2
MPGDLVKTIHHKQKYIVVPQGHCWIEGDNFESSYDSNAFGCIPLGLIVGKVKFILYPLDRVSILNNSFPKHRKLSLLKKENHEKYFVDFKSNEEDNGDYDEEIGDKNE